MDLFFSLHVQNIISAFVRFMRFRGFKGFNAIFLRILIEECKLHNLKLVHFNLLRSFLSLKVVIINWFCFNVIHYFNRCCLQRSCFALFPWWICIKDLQRKLRKADISHVPLPVIAKYM